LSDRLPCGGLNVFNDIDGESFAAVSHREIVARERVYLDSGVPGYFL
jgi:hypothetical protein